MTTPGELAKANYAVNAAEESLKSIDWAIEEVCEEGIRIRQKGGWYSQPPGLSKKCFQTFEEVKAFAEGYARCFDQLEDLRRTINERLAVIGERQLEQIGVIR